MNRPNRPDQKKSQAIQQSVFDSSILLGLNPATGAYVPEVLSDVAPPPGLIVMWYSSSTTPPPGWAFCNGQSPGIPNLKGRFPLGWGDGKNLGDTGGLEKVPLEVKHLPRHTHTLSSYINDNTSVCDDDNEISCPTWDRNWNTDAAKATTSSVVGGVSGVAQPHNNMPPYRVLKFIIKL
jgi:hypothetical protein